MPFLLLLFFIGVPIAEIALFIQAGKLVGLWPTLAAIVATAVIGAALVRAQGLATLARARREIDGGRLPVQEVFTGVCLLIAGALLLTPGFLTDTLGFLLLAPPVRRTVGAWLSKAVIHSRNSRVWVNGEEITPNGRNAGAPGGRVIDAEYTVVENDKDATD